MVNYGKDDPEDAVPHRLKITLHRIISKRASEASFGQLALLSILF
jgi:hypothetical protein